MSVYSIRVSLRKWCNAIQPRKIRGRNYYAQVEMTHTMNKPRTISIPSFLERSAPGIFAIIVCGRIAAFTRRFKTKRRKCGRRCHGLHQLLCRHESRTQGSEWLLLTSKPVFFDPSGPKIPPVGLPCTRERHNATSKREFSQNTSHCTRDKCVALCDGALHASRGCLETTAPQSATSRRRARQSLLRPRLVEILSSLTTSVKVSTT